MLDTSSIEYIRSINEGRGLIYNFFAKTFKEAPDSEFYEIAQNLAPHLNVMAKNSEEPRLKEGVKDFITFLNERHDLDTDEKKEKFEVVVKESFSSLFEDEDKIENFQAHYNQDESILPSCENICKKYNITPIGRADTVASQMKIMATLADKSALLKDGDEEKLKELLKEQINFQAKHLGWYNFLTGALRNLPYASDLYVPMTLVMMGFIAEDLPFLQTTAQALVDSMEDEEENN